MVGSEVVREGGDGWRRGSFRLDMQRLYDEKNMKYEMRRSSTSCESVVIVSEGDIDTPKRSCII